MKLRLSECNYEYLRPPKDVFNVTHTDYYMKHGEGKKAVRKIFEDIKYPEDELQKLKEFEALVAKENIALPSNWTKTDNIKMMYAGKFDFKKCIKIMRLHTEWRASPERGIINPASYKILEDGLLYISGRDKQYRPIIVLNVHKIDLKTVELPILIEALNFVLDVCIKFYFVPGKVENWVFIIETNGAGVINFPFKIVKSVNDATSVNYTSRLDKLYIMNPSPFLGASWKMVQSFLDPETASKVFMLKKSEFGKLLESISPEQLEQRYGGTLPTSTPYWPPVNTLHQPPYTEELKKEIEITKSHVIEAIKFNESFHQEEIKLQKEGVRSKRNSALYGNGSERNSPEIIIKAEQSSPEEQKFAKAAKEGHTEEENISPDNKQKKKLSTDIKDTNSPLAGMIKENVRRSSKQLEVQPVQENHHAANSGYTVNVQRVVTPPVNEIADKEDGFEGEVESNHKVKTKVSAVTFAVEEPAKNREDGNGVILEGKNSFKNELCGFCRPKDRSHDEHTNSESSTCNMF